MRCFAAPLVTGKSRNRRSTLRWSLVRRAIASSMWFPQARNQYCSRAPASLIFEPVPRRHVANLVGRASSAASNPPLQIVEYLRGAPPTEERGRVVELGE